ncbi:hypothetical protein D3C87_664770 [compost metagenome]
MSRRSIQTTSRQRTRSTGTGARVQGAGSGTMRSLSCGSGPLSRKARTEARGSTRLSSAISSMATSRRSSSGHRCSRTLTRRRVMGWGWSVASSDSASTGTGHSDQWAPPTVSSTP